MGQAGWLKRTGLQYHWENDGYACFDDFLAALKQSKRKSIRQVQLTLDRTGAVTPHIACHRTCSFPVSRVPSFWGMNPRQNENALG